MDESISLLADTLWTAITLLRINYSQAGGVLRRLPSVVSCLVVSSDPLGDGYNTDNDKFDDSSILLERRRPTHPNTP